MKPHGRRRGLSPLGQRLSVAKRTKRREKIAYRAEMAEARKHLALAEARKRKKAKDAQA